MHNLVRISFVLLLMLACVSTGYAADYAQFSYTGRVKVQGAPYTGSGDFKFAIVDNAGTTSLWSNDSTSVGGGEPTTSLSFSVNDGVVSVTIGDPGEGFDPINSTIFNHPDKIKLRVWFNDGSHGFQQLLPDMKLVNVELLALQTSNDDFTIYVDGSTGSDSNDGLTTDTAKETIQAAFDVLPERINSNVTIKVFPGVYPEAVLIYGFSVRPGKSLSLVGDTDWYPSSGGTPDVRITGEATSGSMTVDASRCLWLSDVNGLNVKGIHCSYATMNVRITNSFGAVFRQCLFSDGYRGVWMDQSEAAFYDCLSQDNDGSVVGPSLGDGFAVHGGSYATFTRCEALNNYYAGINTYENSFSKFLESGDYSSNGQYGFIAAINSTLHFDAGYSGTADNNGLYGLVINIASLGINVDQNTYSGNTSGSYTTYNGGVTLFP